MRPKKLNSWKRKILFSAFIVSCNPGNFRLPVGSSKVKGSEKCTPKIDLIIPSRGAARWGRGVRCGGAGRGAVGVVVGGGGGVRCGEGGGLG